MGQRSRKFAQRMAQGGILLCLLASGCRRSPEVYPSVEGPLSNSEGLRIGLVSSFLPLYGRRASSVGVNASYLLRDRVNQCGGVNQAPISFVVEQADNAPRSEVAATRDLIDEYRVHGAIANLSSVEPQQSLGEFVSAQVPVLLFTHPSTVVDVTSLKMRAQKSQTSQHYLGQLSPSHENLSQALAQVIWGQGYTQVAFIRVDNASSEQWADNFTETFEALGGQRVDTENPIFVPRYSNFQRQINSALNVESDEASAEGDRLIEPFRFDSSQSVQLSAWLDQEQTAVVVVLDRFRSSDFLQALDPMAATRESVSLFWADWLELKAVWNRRATDLTDSSDSDRPWLTGAAGLTPAIVGDGFSTFKQAWVSHFDEAPPAEAAYAWDAASLFALAAEAAGSNGGSSIATHLQAIASPPGIVVTDVCEGLKHLRAGEEINYQGASGALNLDAKGTVESRFDLWRISPENELKIIDRVTPEADSPATP